MSKKQNLVKKTAVAKKIEVSKDSTGEVKVKVNMPVSKTLQQKSDKNDKNKKVITSKKTVHVAIPITKEEVDGMERAKELTRKALTEVDVSVKPVFRRTVVKKTARTGGSQKQTPTRAKVDNKPIHKAESKASANKSVGRPHTAAKKPIKDWSELKETLAGEATSAIEKEGIVSTEKPTFSTPPTMSANPPINLPSNLGQNPGDVFRPQAQPPVFDIHRKAPFIQPITLSGKPLALKQRKD